MEALAQLKHLLKEVPGRLAKLPIAVVEHKPGPGRWSPKEELGHLLDSAANNHQRIVRVQLEDKLAMPGYDGDQQRDWRDLMERWQILNQQLLAAAEAVPDSAWSHSCTIAASQPMTLKFVFEDYIRHMLHHLRHIGIEVVDFGS
jgi:hypothetical protein